MMEGFGVHTFRLVNAAGESTFVKFHWRPKLGLQSTIWDEAVKITGADPDFHRRDLFEAIDGGDFPEWEFARAALHPGGGRRASLRRPRRDQADPRGARAAAAWSAAWCSTASPTISSPRPSRSPSARPTSCPGIDFSNDPLLQGRLFSYLDTQLSRLGSAEFPPDPDQRAQVPVRTTCSATATCRWSSRQGRVNYEPNSPVAADVAARDRRPRLSQRRGDRSRARKAASVPRASPTTTARRGSSTAARPATSRRTSPRRWCSSSPRSSMCTCARRWSATCANRRGPRQARRRGAGARQDARGAGRPRRPCRRWRRRRPCRSSAR